MGRRRKCRFVAEAPAITVFKPMGVPMSQLRGVIIGLDGLEALRLVDAEGLSQEEAATRMGISRPTLCRTLALARTQAARALSRGWAIRIEVNQAEITHGISPTINGCARGTRCATDASLQGGLSCPDEDKADEDKADRARALAPMAEDRADVAANAEQV